MFSNSIILPTSKWNFSKNADLVVMLNTRKGQILEIFNYYKYNLQVIVIIESPQTNLNIKCVFVTQPLNPTEPDPFYKKTARPAMHSIWKWPLMRFYVYFHQPPSSPFFPSKNFQSYVSIFEKVLGFHHIFVNEQLAFERWSPLIISAFGSCRRERSPLIHHHVRSSCK